MDESPIEPGYLTASLVDQLDRYERWLSQISRDEIIVLRENPEYHDFRRAFERLGQAHRRVSSIMNQSIMSMDESSSLVNRVLGNSFAPEPCSSAFPNNCMQLLTADDVVLRVFEFLDCQSLVRTALTCSRFRQLAYRSASQRTYDVANSRQLNSVMQLLRAKEHIEGVGAGMNDSHVRVPILLLSRRVLITNAGDPEMNGVYICTGINGNGFVFTKPRFPEKGVRRRTSTPFRNAPGERREGEPGPPLVEVDIGVAGGAADPLPIQNQIPSSRFESEEAPPAGKLLRCIIAKRFSNESILWYLSKEVVATTARDGIQVGDVTQIFSFWANLMSSTDVSPDVCRYPSQSSILARRHAGWHGLSFAMQPPTVELLD